VCVFYLAGDFAPRLAGQKLACRPGQKATATWLTVAGSLTWLGPKATGPAQRWSAAWHGAEALWHAARRGVVGDRSSSTT
jgi:hypothetical protein